jgi:potassium efflux system protein
VGSKEINEEITARLKTLDQIEADLRNVATDDPPTLVQARTLVLKTRRMLRQSELALFRLRLENQELLTNLAQAERDLAAAEIIAHQTRLDALNQALQRLGEARAEQVRQESEVRQRQIEALPQPLQNIANENGQYRLEHETLAEQGRAVTNRLQTAQLGLDEIKSDFERTRERVDVVGATQAIGKLLKRRRDALPSLQSYRRTSAERGKEISRATDRQIEIDELLSERADRKAVISKTLALLSEAEVTVYEQSVADLVREQRDLLNELQKVYARYVGQITALDLAERQLVEVASEYTDYIDDQLIWIPGLGLASLLDPAGFAKAVAWLLAPSRWLEVAQDLLTLLQQRGIWSLMVLGLFLVLLSNRQKSLNRLREIAQETRKISTDSFKLTLWALLHTWVVIGAWPVLLIGIGWLLASLPTAATHTLLMANGLLKMGLILASVLLLIQICLPDSLGDRHLRWPQKIRESLVHELRWIIPIVLPLGFVVGATAGSEPPQAVQSFGRLAFVALMLVSSLFIFRLLRSRGTIMQTLTNGKGSLLVQLHFLWFPVLMVTPVIFAFTSALGYHYTAVHLEQRAEQTFWFFFGLFLLKELLLRSLYIADRRLRYEDALRRRDELRAQRAQADEAKSEETSVGSLEIPEIDFAELGEQNKRLVRAGFLFATVIGIWSIWSDLLPALGFLNSTELPLHATRIVDGISKEVPVTLADLTLGLIMVVITVLAAKNIPGVLEITLLQRLPLDSGARYAITSLTQYLIAGIGVFIAFSTLGLQWSNIQWLVAALSVGLGFGLQEIVANFISGIILLFERPIRVGDVVTIDNITGKVSRIRIRATTIINWDKQELLIPNKEFITGRVINWTLTDKINRIVINVGVAYGSNVERAMQLMLEAADENENVLTDPEPVVTFEGFGDNALTLVLRSYLGSMDNRLVTITALHRAINAKFNAAGINIAFPQRDIHLSADQPLDIRLHRDPP